MKTIKHLLARNIVFWWLAICWTILIAILCLVSFDELPKIDIQVSNLDKCIHVIFHFVFTGFWFLGLKSSGEKRNAILFKVFAASLLYGISIEIAQGFFTTTRSADIEDVLANGCGSLSAIGLIVLSSKIFTKAIKN